MNSRRKVEGGGGGFPFITLSNISLVCDADRQNRIRLFSRGTAGKAATVTPMPCSRQYREKYLQGNKTIKLPTRIKQLMRYTYVLYKTIKLPTRIKQLMRYTYALYNISMIFFSHTIVHLSSANLCA